MSTYALLGVPGSPFVRKAGVFLQEKAIDHDFEFLNIFPPSDKLAELHPMKRVPVLRLPTGEHLWDTSAICQYLERVHPERPLYPKDDLLFARALSWEEYGDTEVAIQLTLRVFRPLVMGAMLGKSPDLDRVRKTVERDLPRVFDTLTRQLGEQDYLLGDFGIADIAVATHFVNLDHAGVPVHEQYGALLAWRDRVLGRAPFAMAIAREKKLMPKPVPLTTSGS